MARPSLAVTRARKRRSATAAGRSARFEWFLDEVADKVRLTLKQRVTMATEHVKSKVVKNISRPVTKTVGPRGGIVVTNRSKPGEFPKADTTMLMKTIFSNVEVVNKYVVDGFIGTPLDYGVILETRMNRSFLLRTLREEEGAIIRFINGPIK